MDIEGAGENATVITSAGYSTVNMLGTDNSELRLLTVINTAAGPSNGGLTSVAISNQSSAKLTHVTAMAVGTGSSGWNVGVYNGGGASVMSNVTATASGSSFVNCGIYNQSCAPSMSNVTATGTGGIVAYGVSNSACTVTMDNVTASASEGAKNIGVWNSVVSARMSNLMVNASGGSENYGIHNEFSTTVMSNVTATAQNGAASNCGLYDYYSNYWGKSDTVIDRSTFEGAYAVTSDRALRIGASKLVGDVGGSGQFTCVASYGGDYAPLDASCH